MLDAHAVPVVQLQAAGSSLCCNSCFPRCAPGYFGNPLVIGSSCQPCDCSGNTDPNMLFSSCDPLTGACSGCMHHTAGARCELCAPGYHGDAVLAKNCTREWAPSQPRARGRGQGAHAQHSCPSEEQQPKCSVQKGSCVADMF